MKKFLAVAVFISILLVPFSALAQEIKFKDVPDTHWAKDAVYDLVKKGITQGYPDGTFRGDKNITRYETAMFLSKLAKLVDVSSQIDVSSLKADIKALKDEIEQLKKSPSPEPKGIPVTGTFLARYRVANIVTSGTSTGSQPPRGPRIDYRLKTSLSKDMGDGSSVKINLDTMDSGYNGGSDALATRFLDIEGNLQFHPWDIPIGVKMTAGPGPQVYAPTMDATIPSEVGTIYMRPRNSISAQALLGALEVDAGYTARTINDSGEVGVSDMNMALGYTFVGLPLFEIFKIYSTADYLGNDIMREASPSDMRGTLSLTGSFNDRASTSVMLGASKSVDPGEGYMINWQLSLSDPWETGTFATVSFDKVGAEYINTDLSTAEFDIAGLDNFDKAIINDISMWGLDMTQFLTSDLALKMKAVARLSRDGEYNEKHPECRTEMEGGISYNIAQSTVMNLLYKVYQVPANLDDRTTDVTTFSFLYKF